MTNRPLAIDDINLDDVKYLLYTGQRISITTATFDKILERLEELTQECENLKKLYSEKISAPKIRMIRYNSHPTICFLPKGQEHCRLNHK